MHSCASHFDGDYRVESRYGSLERLEFQILIREYTESTCSDEEETVRSSTLSSEVTMKRGLKYAYSLNRSKPVNLAAPGRGKWERKKNIKAERDHPLAGCRKRNTTTLRLATVISTVYPVHSKVLKRTEIISLVGSEAK